MRGVDAPLRKLPSRPSLLTQQWRLEPRFQHAVPLPWSPVSLVSKHQTMRLAPRKHTQLQQLPMAGLKPRPSQASPLEANCDVIAKELQTQRRRGTEKTGNLGKPTTFSSSCHPLLRVSVALVARLFSAREEKSSNTELAEGSQRPRRRPRTARFRAFSSVPSVKSR